MTDEILQLTSQLIQKVRETAHVRSADDEPAVEAPRAYYNQLTPPLGTMWWKRQTDQIFDQESLLIQIEIVPGWNLTMDGVKLTWRTDTYLYVSGARPDDPSFVGNGGSILIVMVHSGVGEPQVGIGSATDYVQRVKCPSSVTAYKQLPPSGSGTQSGDDWNYSIDFKQTLPMFNNSGNSTFNFDASYREDFSLPWAKQTGITTTNGVEFALTFQQGAPWTDQFPVIGVSVFEVRDPKAFPITFNFEGGVIWHNGTPDYSVFKSKSVKVDLTF